MQKQAYLLAVLVMAIVVLAACGGGGTATGPTAPAAGNAESGKTLFQQAAIGSNAGCATCHSVDGSQLVGPSLQGIGTSAATRVQGQTADQYLRNSLLDPNAHVVEGFAQGIMPAYTTALSDAQVNDMVAYLASLK